MGCQAAPIPATFCFSMLMVQTESAHPLRALAQTPKLPPSWGTGDNVSRPSQLRLLCTYQPFYGVLFRCMEDPRKNNVMDAFPYDTLPLYCTRGMPCTQCARSAKFWMSANTPTLVLAPFHKVLVPYQGFFGFPSIYDVAPKPWSSSR